MLKKLTKKIVIHFDCYLRVKEAGKTTEILHYIKALDRETQLETETNLCAILKDRFKARSKDESLF